MPLLVFFLLHQIVSVYGESTYSIRRRASLGKEEDRFELPKSYELCRRQKECSRFNAILASTASTTKHCLCSCSSKRAATFGMKNGSLQCIDNKEIRERELHDCKRINFINEKETDALKMFKKGESATLNINPNNTQCSERTAGFSYKACDGGWQPLNNTAADWGLQVTKQWSSGVEKYMLRIDQAKQSSDLQGKVVKLVVPCGPRMLKKPFCLLFKVAGIVECPLKHILATSMPSKTRTRTTTKAAVKRPYSEALATTAHLTITKQNISHTTPPTTKFPITTFKLTNLSHTDGDIKTINEASHEVPIPLITGTVGSAVILLLIASFIGLLMCRKRKERHLRKSSTSLELKTTKTDNFIDQYTVVEERARYQSLFPSPDGAMERGVYVPRYSVPGIISDIDNCFAFLEGQDTCSPVEGPTERPACDLEYDYAESSLVVRNNVLKFSFPVSKEKASNTPEGNAPYYHALEGEEEGLPIKEPSEEACGKPEESAPCYRVLEGHNPLDPQLEERAHDAPKEKDPYYHILEGSTDEKQKGSNEVPHEVQTCHHGVKGPTSSLDNQDTYGYKELQSDGRVSTGYQALQKFAYVT